MKPSEKEWKKACKKMGCFMPEFHKVLFEYANLRAYMRFYCELWGMKEFKEQARKEWKEKLKEINKSLIEIEEYNDIIDKVLE